MKRVAHCPPILLMGALFGMPVQAQAVYTELRGYEEVPTLSTPAQGTFRAMLDEQGQRIQYELAYSDLAGAVRQAHIHFGTRGVNGGVMVFLCHTETNPDPTGASPTCPASGMVTGIITPASVVGPAGQGISAGEFAEVIDAIRAGAAYVNVHSGTYPGGELRGQLRDASSPLGR